MAKPGNIASPQIPARDQLRSSALRTLCVGVATLVAFASIAVQLIRLGGQGTSDIKLAATAPLTTAYSRPDIVDRRGRLLATDVAAPSLFADPKNLPNVDETLEALAPYLPGIDTPDMRRLLADRERRFVWIRRRLPTELAEKIHNLGVPGLFFRDEPARSYPRGRLAGHILGHVNIDNTGLDGVERHINTTSSVMRVPIARVNTRPAVQLSIDAAAQFGLESELSDAMRRYRAMAAIGIVMDVRTGEIAAAASLPGVDPMRPEEILDDTRKNRLLDGAYELGSVFKMFSVAQALDLDLVSPGSIVDVTHPLRVGRFTIRDFHSAGRPLTVSEVFVKSSNVGAGTLARDVGIQRQKDFFDALGLLQPVATGAGQTTAPLVPATWGKAANITIAYGHGIAVSPLQFAAAASAMVNGGVYRAPTFFRIAADTTPQASPGRRVIKPRTSAQIRAMMRENVRDGSGRRADVAGYDVGGKTGTADWAQDGRYGGAAVINSFVAAFPMAAPRYVVMVTLLDPKPQPGKKGRTAAQNAAPLAGRVIARLAPVLGVLPASD